MSSALTVAVIGSGMAGLAAAYRCRQAGHEVTVFEARNGHGMDAHGHDAHGTVVDVPLRVMSPTGWRSVLALAADVGVGTFEVDTFVSCSLPDGRAWFRSARMPVTGLHFVGSLRSLNLTSARIGMAALHLAQRLRTLKLVAPDITLAELVGVEQFDPLFWRGLLLPLLITICTCDEGDLLAWPAAQLLSLLDDLVNGERLVRLSGGTPALVDALAGGLRCHSGSPVQHVADEGQQVRVRNARGDGGLYDRVIVATQASQLGFLHGGDYVRERRVLKAIRYARGKLVVHSDERFMPDDRRDWEALNFRTDADMQRPMFTVWVNAVEPRLAAKPPVFQTWNPMFAPRRGTVLASVPLQRAVVGVDTAAVLQALDAWHADLQRRVFYCGSWAHAGVPLLETAVRSAEAVVRTSGVSSMQDDQRVRARRRAAEPCWMAAGCRPGSTVRLTSELMLSSRSRAQNVAQKWPPTGSS
jgi:uncharacterized protein